jgi:hypothetical protein
MAIPLRQRIAAAVTCLVLGVGTFGYMQRTTSEAVSEAPRISNCDPDDTNFRGKKVLGCLTLY